MRRALPVIALVFALLVYGAAYVFARTNHLVVHARTTTRDAHGHFVVGGHDVRTAVGAPAMVVVLTPLRWLETGAWLVLERPGSNLGLP